RSAPDRVAAGPDRRWYGARRPGAEPGQPEDRGARRLPLAGADERSEGLRRDAARPGGDEHLRPRPGPVAVLDVRDPPDRPGADRDGTGLGDRARHDSSAVGPAMTVLVVTNDFPPRQGGIENFVRSLCDELPGVGVHPPRDPGDTAYAAPLPFPVIRDRAGMLLPTARVTKHAVHLLHEHGADRVLFGAAAPLGLMGSALRRAGAQRIVAMTHG